MKRNDIYSSDDNSESGDITGNIGELSNTDFLPTIKDEVVIPYTNDIPQGSSEYKGIRKINEKDKPVI